MTTASGSTRTCRARNCDLEVGPAAFLCPLHWGMVPPPLREAIEGSHRQDQAVQDDPSVEYLALVKAAITAVDHKQSRQARRPPRTPAKPVQLALFELAST